MDFVAIDFETATLSTQFICSCGMARCVNGVISEDFYTLIKPPEGHIDKRLSHFHGITEEMVSDCEEFPAQWKKIQNFIGDLPLVAHSARSADMNFLRKTLLHYEIPFPTNKWGCTRMMAKQLFDLDGYGLRDIADYMGFDFEHHNALADAMAAAIIALYAQEVMTDEDFARFFIEDYCPKVKKTSLNKAVPFADVWNVEPQDQLVDLHIAVTGTLTGYTRQEIEFLINKYGGIPDQSVKKCTNILIIGPEWFEEYEMGKASSNKIKDAIERTKKDPHFIIAPETLLYELITGKKAE